jgi:hypothetical protein
MDQLKFGDDIVYMDHLVSDEDDIDALREKTHDGNVTILFFHLLRSPKQEDSEHK